MATNLANAWVIEFSSLLTEQKQLTKFLSASYQLIGVSFSRFEFCDSYINYRHTFTNVALAEWLRRVPAKYMGFPRESSNLSGDVK